MEQCVFGYGAGRAVSAPLPFSFSVWICLDVWCGALPSNAVSRELERESGAVEQRSSSLARSSWRMPAAAKERVGVAVGGSVGGTGALSINLSSVVIFLDVVVCSVHVVSRLNRNHASGL